MFAKNSTQYIKNSPFDSRETSKYIKSPTANFIPQSHQARIRDIPWHSGVLGTLSLTETPVSSDFSGLCELPGSGTRVHGHGLVDDEAIAQKLADGLAGVGGGDLVDLVGVKPDLALAAADHGGRQALLGAKVDPAIFQETMVFLSVRVLFAGFGELCVCALGLGKFEIDGIGMAAGDAGGTYILMSAIIDGRSLTDWIFEFPQSISTTTTGLGWVGGKWAIS
ncbi:hypothetical protein EMPG_14422 [Blastomyces silverae]|uniref:Uncharacterized protein n=1 Tax=Blastomyces silverae TaxID=2060906 RepID=A0A0H1BFN2_9EURO|nr:hypothetical protein EMPG_14422 [Blastomyces silverae]